MSKSEPKSDTRFAGAVGSHYPADPTELRSLVSKSLQNVYSKELVGLDVRAMIVPGIGYKYSLDVMASAYSTAIDQVVDEVFLFSDPVLHELDFMAFSEMDYWESPLGMIEQSHRVSRIVHDDDHQRDLMKFDDSKHEGEASLEVQLPFLSSIWQNSFRLIPFMLGEVSGRIAGETLERYVDQDDLVICATTFSPGLPKSYAEEIDMRTLEAIENKDLDYLDSDSFKASSPHSLKTLVNLAERRSWEVKVLQYKHLSEKKEESYINMGLGAVVFYS